MTIKVKISNEDKGEERIIGVQQTELDGKPVSGIPEAMLKGGESKELHIHSTNRIYIREVAGMVAFLAVVFGLALGAIAQCPPGGCPQNMRVPFMPQVQISQSSYTPRWHNHDGLAPRDHLKQMHGVASAGMTCTQVRMRMDADHNVWGPQHRGMSRSVVRGGYARATVRSSGRLFPRLWRR